MVNSVAKLLIKPTYFLLAYATIVAFFINETFGHHEL